MDGDRTHRELLLADLALLLAVASARDVAFALQRFWETREEPGASFLAELARVADLPAEDAARLEQEADRIISEAGGDPRGALGRRGSPRRSRRRSGRWGSVPAPHCVSPRRADTSGSDRSGRGEWGSSSSPWTQN